MKNCHHRGGTSVELIVVVALVALGAIGGFAAFGRSLSSAVDCTGHSILGSSVGGGGNGGCGGSTANFTATVGSSQVVAASPQAPNGLVCNSLGCNGATTTTTPDVAAPAPAQVAPTQTPTEAWLAGGQVSATATPRERFGHLQTASYNGFQWRFGGGWSGRDFPRMTNADHAELARLQGLTVAAENAAIDASNAYARAWNAARDSSSSWRSVTPFVDSRDDYATNSLRGGTADLANQRAQAAATAARNAETSLIRAAQTRYTTALGAENVPASVVSDVIAMTNEQRNDLLARMTSVQLGGLIAAFTRAGRPTDPTARTAYDNALSRLRNPIPPQLQELIAVDRASRRSGESADTLASLLTSEDNAALWQAWADERAAERESESLRDEWQAAANASFAESRRLLLQLEQDRQRLVAAFNERASTMPEAVRRNLGTGSGGNFQSFLEQDFEWRLFYNRQPDGSVGVTGRFVPRPATAQRLLMQSLAIGTERRAPTMEIGRVYRDQPYIPPIGAMGIMYYRLHGRSDIVVPRREFGSMRSVFFEDAITVYTTVTGIGGLVRAGGVMWVGFVRAGAGTAERALAVQTARSVAVGMAVSEAQRLVVDQLIPGNDQNSQDARFWLNFTLSTAMRPLLAPRQPRQQPQQQPRTTTPNTSAANRRTALFVRQSCFVAGTLVLVGCDVDTLTCGEHAKKIENVKVDDVVLGVDETTHEPTTSPVARVTQRRTEALRILHVGQQTIRTTDEHPFWVASRGFVPAKEIDVGDRLEGAHLGASLVVDSTESEAHPEGIDVFNFTVKDSHTYYVSDHATDEPFLVHNADQCSLDDIFTGVRSAEDVAAASQLARAAGHSPASVAARVAAETRLLPGGINTHGRGVQDAMRQLETADPTMRGMTTAVGGALRAPAPVSTGPTYRHASNADYDKHLRAPNDAAVAATAQTRGEGQYLVRYQNATTRTSLEQAAITNGFQVQHGGATYYYYRAPADVGATPNGSMTRWIRVEVTSGGVVHSHPRPVDLIPRDARDFFP